MRLFGLVGKHLSHSWSKRYFDNKFQEGHISDARYELFPLASADEIAILLRDRFFCGLNITIPYKQDFLKYLDQSDASVVETGAVNCIRFDRTSGKVGLIGYNTDLFGFEVSIAPLLKPNHTSAILLGDGGAARAVKAVFLRKGIQCLQVVRKPGNPQQMDFGSITREIIQSHLIIVNATPLGMYPEVTSAPDIPYEWLTTDHLMYDLVYNPIETLFLARGREKGCVCKNGLEMLHLQAERSWEIWNPSF